MAHGGFWWEKQKVGGDTGAEGERGPWPTWGKASVSPAAAAWCE